MKYGTLHVTKFKTTKNTLNRGMLAICLNYSRLRKGLPLYKPAISSKKKQIILQPQKFMTIITMSMKKKILPRNDD